MSEKQKPEIGEIVWSDLTVENADEIKDFYSQVLGLQADNHDMGDYNDFDMKTPNGKPVTGVCHAKGVNADIPPQWIVYFNVADLEKSIENCIKLGGKQVSAIKSMGNIKLAIIEDPAGAVCGLIETV